MSTIQFLISMTLGKKTVGKGENANEKHFLFVLQCFLIRFVVCKCFEFGSLEICCLLYYLGRSVSKSVGLIEFFAEIALQKICFANFAKTYSVQTCGWQANLKIHRKDMQNLLEAVVRISCEWK